MRLLAPSRGTHTYWTEKDPVIYEGVIGLTKDRLFPGSLEYFIGDGTHRYSELPKYGGAEASSTKKSNTLVLRDANGLIDSASIPASTTTNPNNVVKADDNGSLSGWKDAIINAVIANDGSGGLATDENGNMMVDFDQMPTDKFEALLKSLKMQIPLEANKSFYVDKNSAAANDTIEDGRGTQEKPFKTIQACVNFVTQNYALGMYNVYIYISGGNNSSESNYDENVLLPEFTRTTGSIYICATDFEHAPKIRTLFVTGGTWVAQRINIEFNGTDPQDGYTTYAYVVRVNGATANLTIQGCNIYAAYVDDTPQNRYVLIAIAVQSRSRLGFQPLKNYQTSITCEKGNATVARMMEVSNSNMSLPRSRVEYDATTYTILCSGQVDVILNAYTNAVITVDGASPYEMVFSGNITGKKYQLKYYSYADMPTGGLPGTIEGTADANTFCIYEQEGL